MKFGQFMKHYKIIFFIEKIYEKCGLETSSRPFLIFKKSTVKVNLRIMNHETWKSKILIFDFLDNEKSF